MIKHIIIGCLIIFTSLNIFSQHVYFGYPNDSNIIKSGDVIILAMPAHRDGRFATSKSLDSLITFLNLRKDLKLTIEINFSLWFRLTEPNLLYSASLLSSLEGFFKDHKIANNYTLISNGNRKPIYPKIKGKKYSGQEKMLYNQKNTNLKLVIN